MLRDTEARNKNVGVDTLLDADTLYLIARTASINTEDFKPGSEDFL